MKMARRVIPELALPFIVVVLLPSLLLPPLRRVDTHWTLTKGGYLVAAEVGVVVFAVGFLLFARCLRLFAEVGEGTLAPWDPPRKLVVVGPYQYVRNPMISSVIVMLLGEAAVCGSALLLGLAGFIFAVNTVYFMLSEEPALERRFGEDYRRYKKNVRRWIPRRRPWTELENK
jgi:protein-S-isoprenylcysteine O-methyltransferase Ste14